VPGAKTAARLRERYPNLCQVRQRLGHPRS
jgi:hypothetical protein